jgi:hypothetical protein
MKTVKMLKVYGICIVTISTIIMCAAPAFALPIPCDP